MTDLKDADQVSKTKSEGQGVINSPDAGRGHNRNNRKKKAKQI
jgi:hypothetical protein